MIYFLSDITSDFARTKGARDKKKRKQRGVVAASTIKGAKIGGGIGAGLGTLGGLATLGTVASLGIPVTGLGAAGLLGANALYGGASGGLTGGSYGLAYGLGRRRGNKNLDSRG